MYKKKEQDICLPHFSDRPPLTQLPKKLPCQLPKSVSSTLLHYSGVPESLPLEKCAISLLTNSVATCSQEPSKCITCD